MQKLVSGFTFIKHGLTLGYPIKESVESIEPLCDEIIINVGYDDPNLVKDDGTHDYLRDHFNHPKFVFVKSYWDPKLKKDGVILAEQTNIALSLCKGKYCQYIQGDEAIHENDFPVIHDSILMLEKRRDLSGLIFNYTHFYGNTDIIKKTRSIYRREVRTIRNGIGIKSWQDAQGFRHQDNSKLKAVQIPATVYHYGWARKEQVMKTKKIAMDKLYHGDNHEGASFTYENIHGLREFTGTHPKVMENWIKDHHNDLDLLSLPKKFEWKNVGLIISDLVEDATNYRIGEYKNFKLAKL